MDFQCVGNIGFEDQGTGMGEFQNQNQGMGMGEFQNGQNQRIGMAVGQLQDHHASPHISSNEPLDLDKIPIDEFILVGYEGTVEEKNEYDNQIDYPMGYSCLSHISSNERLDLDKIAVDEFSLVGYEGTVEEKNEYDNQIDYPMGYSCLSSVPETGPKCEVPLISTMLSPSGSYVASNKETIAKQPITGCYYTIEDVMQRLPRGSALCKGTVGSREILQNNISRVDYGLQSDLNLSSPKLSVSSLSSSLMGSKENVAQNNISPVATGFQSDFSLSSSKLSVSSLSSNSLIGSKESLQNNISPRVNGFQSDFNLSSPRLSLSSLSPSLSINSADKFQSYRLSVDPQCVAARNRRREVQQKIRSLEKLIPLKSKLHTGTMLEEASKYVKFLEAQLHVIELMPSFSSPSNGLDSAGTLNPSSSVRLHSTGNVEEERGGENLSPVTMLNILVTSREVQRLLLSEEKCVGTVDQEYQMAAAAEGSNNSSFKFLVP